MVQKKYNLFNCYKWKDILTAISYCDVFANFTFQRYTDRILHSSVWIDNIISKRLLSGLLYDPFCCRWSIPPWGKPVQTRTLLELEFPSKTSTTIWKGMARQSVRMHVRPKWTRGPNSPVGPIWKTLIPTGNHRNHTKTVTSMSS